MMIFTIFLVCSMILSFTLALNAGGAGFLSGFNITSDTKTFPNGFDDVGSAKTSSVSMPCVSNTSSTGFSNCSFACCGKSVLHR